MLCILPFEKAFYDKHQYVNAHYVGHPLLDEISIPTSETQRADTTKSIALLPGSRKQEINTLLPVMLETARNFLMNNLLSPEFRIKSIISRFISGKCHTGF
jgi:lipid-A-disaccharide synthase